MKRKKQFAALPYRLEASGSLQVLLITSRETGRWVIPKGWPMKNKSPRRAAAIEAFEEAGAVGKPEKQPAGSYAYVKRLKDGSGLPCEVMVFPLVIERLEESWPEDDQRQRRWFRPEDAADLVEEPELADMLRAFERP